MRVLHTLCLTALAASLIACGSSTYNEGGNLASWQSALASQFNLSPSTVAQNSSAMTGKVTICHYPPGNPANMHTITVGASAVPAHFRNHGDTIGPCGSSSGGGGGGDVDAGAGAGGGGGGVDAGTGGVARSLN